MFIWNLVNSEAPLQPRKSTYIYIYVYVYTVINEYLDDKMQHVHGFGTYEYLHISTNSFQGFKGTAYFWIVSNLVTFLSMFFLV